MNTQRPSDAQAFCVPSCSMTTSCFKKKCCKKYKKSTHCKSCPKRK